jgi:c-di-AMP phosphodiesterase-like protein
MFQSRKFILALVAIAVEVLVLVVPETRPYAAEVGAILFAVISVAIGGITVEDSIKEWAGRPATLKDAIREAVEQALIQLPIEPSTPPNDPADYINYRPPKA